MKKYVVLMVTLLFAASAFADVQVRLGPEISVPWKVIPPTVAQAWDNGTSAGLGYLGELIFDQIGYGTEGTSRFTRDLNDQSWEMDFRGQMYVAFHLFGIRTLLDPFVTAGLGAGGWVDITEGATEGPEGQLTGIALALLPSLGAGVGIDLGGLIIGTRLQWFPTTWDVPAAPLPRYTIAPLSASVFVAWGMGAHHRR